MLIKRISLSILIIASMLGISSLFATELSSPVLADTAQQIRDGANDVADNSDKNSGAQVSVVIKNVIGILSFLVGLIAVLMIVIAGFRFVTSNGDANTVSSAKNTIIYAVIGIVITVMAYAIVNFVIDNIK